MKVAIVDELHQIKQAGGVYNSTEILAKTLQDQGIDCKIFSIKNRNWLFNKLAAFPNFREILIIPFWNFFNLKRLDREGYDIVFLNVTTSLLIGRSTKAKKIIYTRTLLARQLKILSKLALPVHLRITSKCLATLILPLEKRSLKKADAVIVPKSSLYQYVIGKIKLDAQRVNIVPQLVHLPEAKLPSRSKTPKKYDLVFVGRLSIPKNKEMLVRIAQQRPYKILALSPMPKTDLPSNIAVLTVPREQLAAQYKSARLLLMPSFAETGPLVTLEAMHCGLPIIASVEGAGDFVENKKNGFIVQNNDLDKYLYFINKLLTDHRLYTQISKRNLQKAKNYEPDVLINKYLQVFDRSLRPKAIDKP